MSKLKLYIGDKEISHVNPCTLTEKSSDDWDVGFSDNISFLVAKSLLENGFNDIGMSWNDESFVRNMPIFKVENKESKVFISEFDFDSDRDLSLIDMFCMIMYKDSKRYKVHMSTQFFKEVGFEYIKEYVNYKGI